MTGQPSVRSRFIVKALRKIKDIALHPAYHSYNIFSNLCNICAKHTVFVCDDAHEPLIRKCLWCHSTPKYRAIAHAIEQQLGHNLRLALTKADFTVYELTTTSALYRTYARHANYVCSGYFPDQPFKREIRPRIYNEDLCRLGFADNSFDLVVSSETMEHVSDPWQAFRELYRVLKPGGMHCFTIPYRQDRPTRTRAKITGGRVTYDLPPVYHQDPYRPQGCLVFTDFGGDLINILESLGFNASLRTVLQHKFDIQDDLRPVTVFVTVKPDHSTDRYRSSPVVY